MTGYLVDTQIVLWWLDNDRRLRQSLRETLMDPSVNTFVSAAAVWEMGIKKRLGKLDVPDDVDKVIMHDGFFELPVTFRHGLSVATLPLHHPDPFDRIMVAQARLEDLTLVHRDLMIGLYDVPQLLA